MYSVTMIAWGEWRAEFVEPVDGGHRVRLRTHHTGVKQGRMTGAQPLGEVVVTEPTETALRGALWKIARERNTVTTFHDANPHWTARLVEDEFRGVAAPERRVQRATKKKAKKKR